ncbi:MAG: hypothetical protein JJ992_29810, partial [Planctomycetes bacterium]|nr:hypothetical protein [Planctomycetota bacterium]
MHRFCCDSTETQAIAVIDDVTGNGASEIGTFRVNSDARMELRVYDAKSGAENVLKTNVFDTRWLENELLAVPGAGRGGRPAIGVAAMQDNGRAAMQLRDGQTGEILRKLTPRNKRWATVDTTTIPGLASGSAAAVATLSRRLSDDVLAVDVRDSRDNSRLAAYNVLYSDWAGLGVESLVVNGTPALAVMARSRVDGTIRIQTREALSGTVLGNYTLSPNFTAIDFQVVPDMNSDGVDEVATMLERSSDGLVVIQIRDALTGQNRSRVYPIGNGQAAWRIAQFRPLDFAGSTALAVLSVHRDDNRVLVRIQDVVSGDVLSKIPFKPSPWELQAEFAVVPDFNGNGEPELAVPLRNADDFRRIVQIRDSADGKVLGNLQLPD